MATIEQNFALYRNVALNREFSGKVKNNIGVQNYYH